MKTRTRLRGIALPALLLAAPGATPPRGNTRAAEIFAPRSVSRPVTHESFNGISSAGTLFFTRCRADFTGCEILEAAPADGDWRVEGRVPFARGGTVSGATVLPGPIAYFHSTPAAPGDGTGPDWKVWEAVGGSWTWSRRRLPPPVNTAARECCAAPDGRGGIYFSSDRSGSWQIYYAASAQDGSPQVEKLPAEINGSPSGQWPSHADGEGRFLLFSSIRPGGPGGDDIYVSFRQGDRWTPARALPAPVNSPAFDDGARVSADGRFLYWSSTRPTSSGDRSANIYRVEVGALLRP